MAIGHWATSKHGKFIGAPSASTQRRAAVTDKPTPLANSKKPVSARFGFESKSKYDPKAESWIVWYTTAKRRDQAMANARKKPYWEVLGPVERS